MGLGSTAATRRMGVRADTVMHCWVRAGTVIAAELQPRPGTERGYESGEARPLALRLRQHGVYARRSATCST